MKKHLLPFALLLFLTTQTKAQTSAYHPFPDSGIVWREYNSGVWEDGGGCCCSSNGPCFTWNDYEYFLAGDTLIKSLVYRMIFQTGNSDAYVYEPQSCPPWCNSSGSTLTYYHNEFVGGIRQDTSQRKIFIYSLYDDQEELLYDFNLHVGDTLPFAYNNYSSNYVSYIDSISIAGNFHRRFWISDKYDTNYVAIIEGIGSTFGLFAPLEPTTIETESVNNLLCVTIDSIPVYPDTATVCELATGVNEIKNIKEAFTIYPNPVTSQLTIQTSSFRNEEVKLSIMNVLGETIYIEGFNGKQETVNCKPFPPGIYFIQLTTERERWVGKFVKE